MNRTFLVEYSPDALDDLRAIYSYIAFCLKERGTAEKQIRRIRHEIRALNEMPERYPPVGGDPWASMGMRKLPVNNYVVYYLTNPKELRVSIVRIFYGGRDVENIVKGENEE